MSARSEANQAKRAARAEFVTRLFVVILLAVVAALVVTIFQIRQTQLDGTPTGKKLVASADRILDCTDPQGQCYRRSQRRTKQAVGDIGRYVVLAAACSASVSVELPLNDRIAAISECVTDRLARRHP